MSNILQYLKEKLWDYIVENNPELMFTLQEKYGVRSYLENKVAGIAERVELMREASVPLYQIREECMQELTAELRPSRYNYVLGVLEEEFAHCHDEMRESGTLTYEIVNMLSTLDTVFDTMGFGEETEGDRMIRYAIIGHVDAYLKGRK